MLPNLFILRKSKEVILRITLCKTLIIKEVCLISRKDRVFDKQ